MTDTGCRVLVVDDEPSIRRFLRTSLGAHGYRVFEAASGAEALSRIAQDRPDLVVLDLGLRDIDGVDVVRQVREWSKTPIIILSVRDREADKIEALDAGADDYLTKPFGIGELTARLRVALRRTAGDSEALFVAGELEIDFTRRVVRVSGEEARLTPTEYDVLRVLAIHAGKVLTHQHLLRRVWDLALDRESVHLLRVNISNLRRKLEADSSRPRLEGRTFMGGLNGHGFAPGEPASRCLEV